MKRGSNFAKGQRWSHRGERESELPPWRKGNPTMQDLVAEKGKHLLRIQKESLRVLERGFWVLLHGRVFRMVVSVLKTASLRMI